MSKYGVTAIVKKQYSRAVRREWLLLRCLRGRKQTFCDATAMSAFGISRKDARACRTVPDRKKKLLNRRRRNINKAFRSSADWFALEMIAVLNSLIAFVFLKSLAPVK
jgi:hypothetical protein